MPSVLWWGRFDSGYSRNRILRKLFAEMGWQVNDFHPKFATVADWEARLHRLPRPDLIWVPCFRQRDLAAASRWAKGHGVPLIFDPLISAYDKQVDEREKLHANSRRAKKLLAWEQALFQRADRVIADTPSHADYFAQVLGVPRKNLAVIYVGAEAALFKPEGLASDADGRPLELLFYGSFIPLQAPPVVIEAARLYQGPPVKWVLLGQGPLRKTCEEKARGLANVTFEDWMPYAKLPARIHQADILLGVFGTTPKAGRVIPNKVFQSLACGKPVITRSAGAYPEDLVAAENSGLVWIPAGDAQSLADRVAALATDPGSLRLLGEAADNTSRHYFSEAVVRHQLNAVLKDLPA
ncbi:MAG: glycosyltransferase [Thiobacillus sp.]|nr:glycosyltransferase [Thiobacillus sp.]